MQIFLIIYFAFNLRYLVQQAPLETEVCDWECEETVGGEGTGDPGDVPAAGPGDPASRKDFPRCYENSPEEASLPDSDTLSPALNAVNLIFSPDLDWKNFFGLPGETFGSEMEVFD